MGLIVKEEIKYLLFSSSFAFIFFVLVIPFILKKGLDKINPAIQFLIFNIAIFIFLNIYLKAKVLERSVKIRKIFETMLIFVSLDIWIPPLLVLWSGKLSTEAILSASSSDYFFGYLAQSMGISGIFVYLFTYLLVPTFLLFLASKLNGNFVKKI